MEDLLEVEEKIRRGEQIGRFMADETVQKVFSDIELTYWRQWQAAEAPAERELLWAKSRVLGDLKQVLQAVVDEGDLATHELERAQRDTAL